MTSIAIATSICACRDGIRSPDPTMNWLANNALVQVAMSLVEIPVFSGTMLMDSQTQPTRY